MSPKFFFCDYAYFPSYSVACTFILVCIYSIILFIYLGVSAGRLDFNFSLPDWQKFEEQSMERDKQFKVKANSIPQSSKLMYQDYIICRGIKPVMAFTVICINITLLPRI